MWILLKLFVAAIAYGLRLRAKEYRDYGGDPSRVDGVDLKTHVVRGRNGVHATVFVTEWRQDCVFQLTRERWYDRLFKALGLAVEMQAGDRAFDELVYVACDHPGFAQELHLDARVRASAAELVALGAAWIRADGLTLRVKFSGAAPGDPQVIARALATLKRQLADLPQPYRNAFGDPFVRRAILVEGLIWAAVGYGVGGLGDWFYHDQHVHLDQAALVVRGLWMAGGLAAVLGGLILLLLGGSSRSHRIFVESFLLLSFGLPLTGIHLTSDLNRALDRGEAVTVEARVNQRERHVSRRRRGGETVTYFLHLDPLDRRLDMVLPPRLQVSREVFANTAEGTNIPVRVRPGRFGLRWIEGVNGVVY